VDAVMLDVFAHRMKDFTDLPAGWKCSSCASVSLR
jgi:hypothetical protein